MYKDKKQWFNLVKSILFSLVVGFVLILPLLALWINLLILYIRFLDWFLLLISLTLSLLPLIGINVTIITYNHYLVKPIDNKHYLLKYGVPVSVFMFIFNGLLIITLTPIFF
ncbi:MAG: hypothetical protein ACLFRI_06280 [Candidatus Izemoplasmataceae bacterium]